MTQAVFLLRASGEIDVRAADSAGEPDCRDHGVDLDDGFVNGRGVYA
jgi:hypothetical protein